MTEHAPGGDREQVDEAIRALFEHDGRTVSSWVLVIGTTRIDAEAPPGLDPISHGGGYSIGPGTSPATALGLVDGAGALLRRLVRDEILDEE